LLEQIMRLIFFKKIFSPVKPGFKGFLSREKVSSSAVLPPPAQF
jgi:hypothetical protein